MLPTPEQKFAELMLEPHIIDEGSPAFLAIVEGRPARIELQSSAIMALVNPPLDDQLFAILDQKREKIRVTAQRLYNEGFYRETEKGIEIELTAIDF